MANNKKTLLAETTASAKRNLLSVGGHSHTPVDLIAVGNTDTKRPYGQTVLIRIPTQAEFVECWSETIIRTLVTTSRIGQTAVCMGKGTALEKRDTTLPHHHITRKIIPTTDRFDDEVKDDTAPITCTKHLFGVILHSLLW
jgi:hypothetical protein